MTKLEEKAERKRTLAELIDELRGALARLHDFTEHGDGEAWELVDTAHTDFSLSAAAMYMALDVHEERERKPGEYPKPGYVRSFPESWTLTLAERARLKYGKTNAGLRRRLIIAAALLVAEAERLQRLEPATGDTCNQ